MNKQEQPKAEPITDQLIDEIFAGVDESKVSKWEFDFLNSTRTWWKQNRKLSDKQKKRLSELWKKHNNAKPRTA